MYEQVSHATLNRILDELKPDIRKKELRFFYSRLGANFYAVHSLFEQLYGSRSDFYEQLKRLVEVMAKNYIQRPESYKVKDREKEANHNWFLHQRWVGMVLYANCFSKDLDDLTKRVGYFTELGVNFVHILPILKCPEGYSDGGYAVSDFRQVDERFGSNESLEKLIDSLHEADSLITLDIVVNHTSDQHEWAQQARAGSKKHQDLYYTFDNRDVPDMFEQSMPEVFPETDPGNFTWDETMQKWVMTVFHDYQWDLNYSNPEVFTEMIDIILFWANKGVDVVRLDAVAFLWKKIGTACQNEQEAHLILQLFKDCCQVVAPGLLSIAEAIVSPSEIIKYFGEDAVVAKECEIAYNATYMALLWDSVATKNARLLRQGLKNLPGKLEGATWLNYLRCHDDIGFGFDDQDIFYVG
ncbi:MAG: alpha-amylase family glycosyl hydrolase, partial [Spirochaetaceae bacterium]|nr:alpha-amylase family glycosyl hydrolase [Spirochaetaceae bacterium]